MSFRSITRLLLAFTLMAVSAPISAVFAQDDDAAVTLLIRADIPAEGLPKSPAFVRLLRINLEGEAGSPLHTHPGPEIGLIETGTVTVEVKGQAVISRPGSDATPAPPADAPLNAEFELESGDQIAYFSQTPMTFVNNSSDPASILTAVILPAGHQHPPGITYLEGNPDSTAFDGVTPEILGDGIASSLPVGPSVLTVERVRLQPGEPIPASDFPTLYSVDSGPLDFVVISGKVQPTRSADPGPQADAAPGTNYSMGKNDAIFFPLGNEEVNRDSAEDELVLLRLTIAPTGEEPGTPVAGARAEIELISPDDASPATPTADDAGSPVAEETPEPTAEPTPDVAYPVDTIVQVNDEGVRMRAAPSTEGEIITTLELGQLLIVIGAPEEGSDFLWWPVALVDDPSVTGYVVDDFLSEAETQQDT